MGADSKRKPPLPAPTESDSTAGMSELATDLSRATEKSSYSIPEDGSPITIATRRKREKEGDGKLSQGSHPSQTSLLIEYFEGGKEGKSDTRRPSVRVRVTPSSHRRSKSSNDHIQITESSGSRKPSYTKRIALNNFKDEQDIYEKSLSEATGSNVTSNGGDPIDIDFAPPRRHGSPLIPSEAPYSTYMQDQNGSEISSMPPNSFLDSSNSATATGSPRRKRSKSLSHGEALAAGAAAGLATAAIVDTLKTPTRSGSQTRSLSKERITQKAIEKIKNDQQSERRRKSSKSRARSTSGEMEPDGTRTPRRRSSRNHNFEESLISGTDSSLLSSHPAQSQQSYRSGTSKSSLNNPKLLETVEDAIRRLILPELTALKREQSKHAERRDRDRERRGSFTSGSGVSRESREETSAKPRVTVNGKEVVIDGDSLKGRKEGVRERESIESSERSFERGASEETVTPGRVKKRTSSERHRGIEALAAGGAIGALTAAALHKHDSKENLDDTRERRRRRNKGHSTGDSVSENIVEKTTMPMPMMSEINGSEMTRTSIQSAETDRPVSVVEEQLGTPIHEVSRGQAANLYGSPSPPLSPTSPATPIGIRQGLGTQHNNYSRGDLSLRSQNSDQHLHEYERNEYGELVPTQNDDVEEYDEDEDESEPHSHAVEAGLVGAAAGAGLAALHHRNDEESQSPNFSQYGQYTQQVPPPLRYVPYAQEHRRGLSPIQSVSSWRESDMDPNHPTQRDSGLARSVRSYSSLGKRSQHKESSVLSYNSMDSARSAERNNRHDFEGVREGGLAESELTQDSQDREYWEEQGRTNSELREYDDRSYRDSGAYSDRSGQNVRSALGTNIHIHTPVGVESAVASIVDASVLTGDSNQSGHQRQLDRKASYASFDEGSEQHFTSRGNSPVKQHLYDETAHDETRSQGVDSQRSSPNKYVPEYELDENGRKVTMPSYRRSHLLEAGAIGGAAGMAAGALASHRNHNAVQEQREYESQNYGSPQNKSFKERAMENIALAQTGSPHRSVGRSASGEDHIPIKMTASGIPDAHDPMPEIGYGDGESEVTTNPSIIHGPMGAAADADEAAAMESHIREGDQDQEDEWRRTSAERKRDTLVTNPYEDISPVAPGSHDRAEAFGLHDFGDNNVGSPLGAMKDEGYISSAPNGRSPDLRSPERRSKGVGFINQDGLEDPNGGDPFYTPKHSRHISGLSEGMESPLYDSTTGNGMDRIKNKDIIALMEHLTVRDAQRSARDTEILITLVRAAAENRNQASDNRNQFEDLKRLLADTEDVIITEVQRNTDKSIMKGMNEARPQPSSAPRSFKSQDLSEDVPGKRKNVFKRALKGLGLKSTNDLGRIEDLMMQILGDVEDLKKAHGISQQMQQSGSRAGSYIDLQENGAYDQDRGYEPEGHAGTSTASHASQSGHFSNPHSRGTSAVRPFESRRNFSDHRISTVPEGDEDALDTYEQTALDNQFENNEELLTPTREIPRGGSAPLKTPPQVFVAQASNSNENTPKTDKSKKHKSSSSSGWLPKFKSRWSETTASTVAKGFRSNRSSKQQEDYRPVSKSGSDVRSYDGQDNGQDNNNPWNLQESDKLHTGFSQDDMLQNDELNNDENEPVSPLLPPEDPKYKAHRNSLNLQHPQPRPGPTHRYQTALEVKAQDFKHPQSPKSMDWGSNTSINRLPQINRYSTGTGGNLSPISDAPQSPLSMHSQTQSSSAPPRPPKEPLSNTGPERPLKIRNKLSKPSPLNNQLSSHHSEENLEEYGNGGMSPVYASSPRSTERRPSALSSVPVRKPIGPRSMSTSSKSGDLDRDNGTVIRRNVNRDTFGTVNSHHSGESEIF